MISKLKVYNSSNQVVEELELNGVFEETPNYYVIKDVIDHQRFCAMLGTNKTKNLSEVSGTGKKPFRQKGTGRARQGTSRAAHMVGGYAAMAPRGEIREKFLNKKVKAKGLLYALIDKMINNKLIIINDFPTFIKTKEFISFSKGFDMDKNKVLFVDRVPTYNFGKSLANVPYKNIISIDGVNVYDVVKNDTLCFTKDAFLLMQALLISRIYG